MKIVFGTIQLILLLIVNPASHAVTRHVYDGPFRGRTAVSTYLGIGVPIGEFSDERNGNHKAGGLDWSLGIEHYFDPNSSIGFSYSAARYDDKEFGDALRTRLNTFFGYFKYTFVTRTNAHPFIRLGLGSVEVEFDSDIENVDAEFVGAFNLGGGVAVMLGDNFSVNGMAYWAYGWTDDAFIREADAIVGFDVSYWAFDVGVSVYFP